MSRAKELLKRILEASPQFNRLSKWSSKLLALVLILVLCGIIFYPRHTLFTLEARSEKLVVKVVDEVLAEWHFDRLSVFRDPFDTEDLLALSDATLLVNPGAEVEFNRNLHGPLQIVVRAQDEVSAGEIIDASGQRIELGPWSSLRVETMSTDANPGGKAMLIPFRGIVDLGDDVATGVTGVLLEGKVQIAEEELIGNTRYVANITTLDRGDRISLFEHNTREPAIVEGFVRVGLGEALEMVAHGPAGYVMVQRLGSGGYTITPSIWRRIMEEPLLASLVVLIGILGTAFGAVSAFEKLFQPRSHQPGQNGDDDAV